MTITPLPMIAAPVASGNGGSPMKGLLGGADFGALVLEHLARLSGDPQHGFDDPVDAVETAGTPGGDGAEAGTALPGDQAADDATGKPVALAGATTALPVLDAAPAAAAICATPDAPKLVLTPVREAPAAARTEAEAPEGSESPAQTAPAAASGGPGGPAGPALPLAGPALPVAGPTATLAREAGHRTAPATAPGSPVAPQPGAAQALPESARSGAGNALAADLAGRRLEVAEVVPVAAPAAGSGSAPATVPGFAWTAVPAAPVDAPAAVAAPNAPDGGPLMDQVTPVVARMVSAGEGSHRMVLRLHPADLGEVHLTVTVRGEDVDVTVAASREARDLLAEGGGQLRALLDSVGRSAGQVVFRDLPGTAAPAAPVVSQGAADLAAGPDDQHREAFTGSGPGADGGTGARPGRPDQPDPAGTTGSRPGTDNPAPNRPGNATAGSARGALDVRI